jgi:phage baseplate assembly protein W
MAVTRADTLTGTKKQREFFSDFVTSFSKTPLGDQLGRVTNEQSVNQSLRNLIKTNLGERPFQPLVGSDVLKSLFENNTPESIDLLELYIENTVRNNEPRVNLIETIINTELFDSNSIEISLIYNLINNPEPTTLTILLKRVR